MRRPSHAVCASDAYASMADAVRAAMADGLHPKLIAKGSSGSYFARAKVEGRVQTVGCVVSSPTRHR